MNELQVVSTSRQVAKDFDISHSYVTKKIERMCKVAPQVSGMYQQTLYVSKNGRTYNEYLMEKDGLMLLIMHFKGKKARKVMLGYIEEFNRMEQKLRKVSQN